MDINKYTVFLITLRPFEIGHFHTRFNMPTRYVVIDGKTIRLSKLVSFLKKIQKPCPDGKERNIRTGKCRSKCVHGKSFKTEKCLKACETGYARSNRCKKTKVAAHIIRLQKKKKKGGRPKLRRASVRFTAKPKKE